MSGTGETGPTIERGVLRGATTIIEGALENSLLSWFDAPPEGTELEGATGPGDSGSGAFIRDDRGTWLVAVCSFTAGSEAPPPRRHYGSFSGLARISTRRDWITETITSAGGASLWSPLAAFHGDETAYKKRARAFVDAFNSVDQQRVASFISGNLPPGKRPASESAAGWMPVIGEYAPYRVCGYSSDRNGRKALLVYSERAKIFRGVMLEISKDAPHLITSIDMWDATVPEDTPCRG